MSGSGFRGRGFGPRGARTNGPNTNFNGPRFQHPTYNHPRSSHRLPGPDKWVDGPNFVPWQQNKNFVPRSQYRGNLQYRSNGRGRVTSGRGIVRFSGPGRPPAPQFFMGFVRNPAPRVPLVQEEVVTDKAGLIQQTPLLGSEEERQRKISETADKLKQKLSTISEEELTNFWEDDLSVLPNSSFDEDSNPNKGIPVLRHEPPELDLTFTDFRDIGRVDGNNSKLDNLEDKDNPEDISIIFEGDNTIILNTNDEIDNLQESRDESLNILDSMQDSDVFNQENVLLDDNQCQNQIFHEFSDSECNLENFGVHSDNINENLIPINLSDIDENQLSETHLDENIINEESIEPLDQYSHDLAEDKSLNLNDVDVTSAQIPVLEEVQNEPEIDFSQDQDILHTEEQDINIEAQQNDHAETDFQIQDNLQTDIFQEESYEVSTDPPDSSPNGSQNLAPSNEEIQANITSDSQSPMCTSYNEAPKLNEDIQLNNPPAFQPRVFNPTPRFTPRIPGPRCRWTFQQNGRNSFARGPQRMPFHGNRMPPPRHMAPLQPTGILPVFDPRAPPLFPHNLPVPSHDPQHHPIVPFSPNDLPPAFDPSEPPPNMRPIPTTESTIKQEITKSVSPLDSRNQTRNKSLNNMEILQPPPAFDPRGPPPKITSVIVSGNDKLPEFNPQKPPPKIHKQEETLQPPPIFDPRLSSQERSNLLAPLDTAGSSLMPVNLIETPQISDFSIASANFSQLPSMSMPSHQPYMNNLALNFQSMLPHTNSGQIMVRDFAIPPPPISINEVPPPLPEDSTHNQSLNMDDGLEDMQEAMEFAKQVMNMTEEMKNNQDVPSVLPELPLPPAEIPVPHEDVPSCSSSVDQVNVTAIIPTVKKQKKRESKSKKPKQNVVYGPELLVEMQQEAEAPEEQIVQNQEKSTEDALPSVDQIRPKVIFNLNSKTKKIQKQEEWHRPINIPENKETSQHVVQNHSKEKTQFKKHSFDSEKKNNVNHSKSQQREHSSKRNSSTHSIEIVKSTQKKSNDTSHQQDNKKTTEKSHSSIVPIPSNTSVQKTKKSKKDTKKTVLPTSESSWKNRVISRFLKMSKNDICNMVNNSSLRKFDIAMKHLVKEKRSTLSLEMRTTEDEKMKEYDREEFMTQLNAMLDPGAIVGITDLPTEFIHHLSEVLQLDPMPFDLESFEQQSTEAEKAANTNESDTLKTQHVAQYLNEEIETRARLNEYTEQENIRIESTQEKPVLHEEESRHSLSSELNLNVPRKETSSSRKSSSNKSNPEVETTYKKQQPLFNNADLDSLLSEVTEKTKNLPGMISSQEPRTSFESYNDSSLIQPVIETYGCGSYPRIPTKTAADLDDIFAAGIARVRQLSKKVDSDNSRVRKSSSEDRNTFRSERYERWNRKEREDPDTFRNLTKEEWEAKYGSINAAATSSTIRKSASNSAENLSRDKHFQMQRYCSSDSPMRHLSMSPFARESSSHASQTSERRYNEFEESRRPERSESSDSSTESSSDSGEETVAPNVTKLLKVIKEKEKIAKKKSLNETIRDEVAAEIEKKWKEKNRYKERKSRKRERRKRDRRERRKREKKKKRKRSSYSDTSKSSDQAESFRLLTEDEIKKEVVVKEEPVSTWDENSSFNSEFSNTVVSTAQTIDPISRIDSQYVQAERQQTATTTSDIAQQHAKSKPVIISTVQTKTKAQLKQMPESSDMVQRQMSEKQLEIRDNINTMKEQPKRVSESTDTGQRQVLEKSNEDVSTKNSTNVMENQFKQMQESSNESSQTTEKPIETVKISTSIAKEPVRQSPEYSSLLQEQTIAKTTDTEKSNTNITKVDNEKIKESTVATENNERSNAIPPINDSWNQTNVSLSLPELPQIDLNDIKITVTSSVPATNTSAQNSSQRTSNTSGYRKIDIKAYKERRMKEQAKLKECSGSPASLAQELQNPPAISKAETVTENVAKEEAEVDANKTQLKDPRLMKQKVESPSDLPSAEVRDKESPVEEQQQLSPPKNVVPVQSKDTNESLPVKNKEKCNRTDDSSTPKTSDKPKDRKSSSGTSSQDTTSVKESEEKARVKSKHESDEKLKKSTSNVDSNKFKNIRSEGSKELKLKKEKSRKSKKKKKSEKEAGKHSRDKASDNEKPSISVEDNSAQIRTENTSSSSDTRESLQTDKAKGSPFESQTTFTEARTKSDSMPSIETTETKLITNNEINEQENNTSVVEENNKKSDSNEEPMNIDANISENKESVDEVDEGVLENKESVDQVHKETLESEETVDQGVMETEDDQSLLLSTNEGETAESGECMSKNIEASMTESIFTEKSNTEGGGEEISGSNTQSVSTEQCSNEDVPMENVEQNNVAGRLPSLNEGTETDAKEANDLIDTETLKDAAAVSDPVANSETSSETNVSEQKSPETKKDESRTEPEKKPEASSDKIEQDDGQANTLSSPDSSGSPFKGFIAESVEDDSPVVSKLYDSEIGDKDTNLKIDSTVTDEKGNDHDSSKELKTEKEALKSGKIEEVAEEEENVKNNVPDEVIDNSSNNENNVPSTTTESEARKDTLEEYETHISNIVEERVDPSLMDINSRDSFNEDSEPFIVLDEYIDDTDGRSIDKLSNIDLDLEDCIARDAEICLSKDSEEEAATNNNKSPNFDTIDFRELSDTFNKKDNDEEGRKSVEEGVPTPTETELFSHAEKNSRSVESSSEIVENLAENQGKNVLFTDTRSEDASRELTTHESLSTETGKTEQNLQCSLKINLQSIGEASNETRTEATVKPSSTENLSEKSSESLAVTSTVETNIEFSEPNKETNNAEETKDKGSDNSLKEATITDKETNLDTVTENEKSEKELAKKDPESPEKLNKKERCQALHKIINKSKTKHKKQKKHNITEGMVEEAIASDTVKIKYPNTKEDIMARMIEIDVEIHKLMTEKMTLYKMLTNDTLPAENELRGKDAELEEQVETTVVRPRTPSALMSQLIQNIETSPVSNPCGKTAAECTPVKDSKEDSISKHKDKKGGVTSTAGSDDEEVMKYTTNSRLSSCKKKKRHRSERTVKWDKKGELRGDVQEANTEKKQGTDVTKSILKKSNSKSDITEQDSDQVLANDSRVHEESSKETNVQAEREESSRDKIETAGNEANQFIETTESQIFRHEPKPPTLTAIGEMNEKETLSLGGKSMENRTPERSSIYSDDSTWESLLQNPHEEQKKINTGLALLEETYRKEMARSRKTKVETRRKRKRKGSSRAEIILTPEEEELPLSALYEKKLHHKKKLNVQDQQVEGTSDDPQLWRNVDEIINAVAENRTDVLYGEQSEGTRSADENRSNVPDVDHWMLEIDKQATHPETNIEEKSLEPEETERVSQPALRNIEEPSIEPSIDSTEHILCKTIEDKGNDSRKDDPQLSSTKPLTSIQSTTLRAFLGDEELPQLDPEAGTESNAENPCEMFQLDASMNIENNIAESPVENTAENDKIEPNRVILIESSVMSIGGKESDTDIPEFNFEAEKVEEGEVLRNEEANVQEETADTDRNISVNVDEAMSNSENIETSHDSAMQVNRFVDVTPANEIVTGTPQENSNFELESVSEDNLQGSTNSDEREAVQVVANTDTTSEMSSRMSRDEQFRNLKVQKSAQRKRELEAARIISEENNNRNRTSISSVSSISSLSESQETARNEDVGKKLSKRKRGSSKTPIRRSSRNTEEITKRVKRELINEVNGVSVQSNEQESQDRNFQTPLPSISPTSLSSFDEEAENTPANTKRTRVVQRTANRKRCLPPDIELLPSSTILKDEPVPCKQSKRMKQHTMSQMLNCEVRLVDSKHTILKANVNPVTLRKYGISAINSSVKSSPVQVESTLNSMQSTSVKESLSASARRAAQASEFPQEHSAVKLIKRIEDATVIDQIGITKVKRLSKPAKSNSSVSDKEESADPDVEVMPVLTRQRLVVDISQESEKPDIEIVEERVLVTKNQQRDDSGSTVSVIEPREEKELPRTQYTVHKGPILDIKVYENSFLAASEDSRIYRYSQASNGILNIYKGHKAAVTCLFVYNTSCADISKEWMFSGSLDGTLRCYNITTGAQVRDAVDIGSPIQCMDEAWGMIYIGTKSGHVSRYHVKTGVLKGSSIQFSDKSVLALKATNEGPRRVLIVASRSQPITIRDAQSGLFLRTICGQKSHTVYSLMRDHNLIYCGTSSTSILVFDFTNGEQTMQYDAGVGIVCMRLYKQLLFAGCYDGNIYVFDTKDHRLVCSIPGPGNMLLSVEVIDNKIIAGSKDKRLQSWQIPWQVRALL